MPELLYIFLVLLLVPAWIAGRAYGLRLPRKESTSELARHYFHGINFLLNEQPDQAIDTFIRSVDVTPHTLETHLTLGNLMRQRGEVDRAIRVHQNLLSRPSLNQQQIGQAHLELGRDFLKAGLLDRAERLFLDLVEDTASDLRQESLRHLVQIYRDEQEWEKAIRAASMMQKNVFGGANNSLAIEQAHFCCELAERCMAKGGYLDARRHLKVALQFNKNSARANILWGDLEMSAHNFQEALKRYRLVPHQEPDRLPKYWKESAVVTWMTKMACLSSWGSGWRCTPGLVFYRRYLRLFVKRTGKRRRLSFLVSLCKRNLPSRG